MFFHVFSVPSHVTLNFSVQPITYSHLSFFRYDVTPEKANSYARLAQLFSCKDPFGLRSYLSKPNLISNNKSLYYRKKFVKEPCHTDKLIC